MIVAAFDFDCTISTRDTLLPFLRYITPSTTQFIGRSIKLLPLLCAYKLGMIENQEAKEQLLKTFLQNHSLSQLEIQGKEFAKTIIPTVIKPEAIARLRWHQAQKHHCVLISAGLEIYLTPWAQEMGFDAICATKLALSTTGLISGKIDGHNCYGAEKVNRLLKEVGPKNYTLYAYGDSRGDKELLALADFPFYRTMPNEN